MPIRKFRRREVDKHPTEEAEWGPTSYAPQHQSPEQRREFVNRINAAVADFNNGLGLGLLSLTNRTASRIDEASRPHMPGVHHPGCRTEHGAGSEFKPVQAPSPGENGTKPHTETPRRPYTDCGWDSRQVVGDFNVGLQAQNDVPRGRAYPRHEDTTVGLSAHRRSGSVRSAVTNNEPVGRRPITEGSSENTLGEQGSYAAPKRPAPIVESWHPFSDPRHRVPTRETLKSCLKDDGGRHINWHAVDTNDMDKSARIRIPLALYSKYRDATMPQILERKLTDNGTGMPNDVYLGQALSLRRRWMSNCEAAMDNKKLEARAKYYRVRELCLLFRERLDAIVLACRRNDQHGKSVKFGGDHIVLFDREAEKVNDAGKEGVVSDSGLENYPLYKPLLETSAQDE